MLRQRAKLFAFSIFIGDLILIAAAFLLSYWIRDVIFWREYGRHFPLLDYLWILIFILPVWSSVLGYFGLYESFRTKPIWAEPLEILKIAFWATLLVGTFIFIFKLHYVSRLFIVIFGIISFFLLSFERLFIRSIAIQFRKRGFNYRNIIIVGTGKRAREIADVINAHKNWGLRLMGFAVDNPNGKTPLIGKYPVIGNVDDIPRIIKNDVVDEVIFAVSRKRLEELENLFLVCEEQGVRTRIAVNFFPHMIAKVHLDDLHGVPLLTFTTTPNNEFMLAIKRSFDIIFSGILMALL